MSYQREVTCPLCMEAMDMTDQQFRPCKCGYQICVWCWNHMVEEAEKDEVLCPACRNPYDKEKIKGMTVGRDRLAEINSKEKQKMQKAKSKTSEGRYDPNENRVIQRNLVYITGIPVNLANEETLRKREYFGQYGQILKILFKPSKPGSPHHSNSSAVYVTFSKEEEAIRCIQHVNGFILNGSPLKACYGTSRYCISFLLKKPCKNHDCSFLHYAAPQGDICTKDEVASVCTSKLRQCLGTASIIQRRSGSFLPPMDFFYSVREKPFVSSVTPIPSDCGRDLRSGDSEKSVVPSRSASCCLPVASDTAFNGSSTVCEEPFNTSSMSNSSITSPTVMKFHALEQAQDEYGSKEKILTRGSQGQYLGGLENYDSSQLCCQNGYPLEHAVPTFDASSVNNMVIKNTIIGPHYLGGNDITKRIIPDPQYFDSSGYKQLTSVETDLTRQDSSSIPHSATSRVNCTPTQSRESFAISMQDSLISNLQAMALRSASASQKVPLNLNWSSGSSDYELLKLASRYEAKDTYAYPDGIRACHARATIGQRVGECSTLPYNGIGTSHPEQEMSHPRYSSYCMQDLKNIEVLYTGIETSRPEQKPHTRYSSCMQDLKRFEVHTNNCGYSTSEAVNDSQHLLRLRQSAPSISNSVLSPPPSSPPGFPTRPSSSGNADFNFCGNQSVVNSYQNILTSNSYFSVEPIDVLNMASNYRSNLVCSVGNGRTVQHQPSIGNMYENPIEIDQSKNYINQTCLHGSQETCTFGSPTAMDSRVIGRRVQPELNNTANSGTSVLCQQLLQPFYQRNDQEFQAATDFSHYYYSQHR